VFGAVIFGGVNAIIKPVIATLSFVLTCVTLGLFTLIINTAMLALTAWIAGLFDLAFEVDGFIAAFLGALVIAVVSTIMSRWAQGTVLRPAGRDDYDSAER
jgi:putative membrane protein